jgi:putative transposase
MARKVRIEFPGAIYHVIARGNERVKIFHEAEDYELFLGTLNAGLERFAVNVHAYCLMPNHFHLAVQTPEGNLSRFMAWLQTTFTARYNRKYRRSGHLFQGRYRAELVEDAAYAKWLILYIHLNPIRRRKAGVVSYVGSLETLNRFRWSSHRAWMNEVKPAIQRLKTKWLFQWSPKPALARKAYQQHLKREIGKKEGLDWKDRVEMGLAVGGEAFLDGLGNYLKGKKRELGGSEARLMKQKSRAVLLQKVLAKEKDQRLQIWLRVRLLGEIQVDLAKELGYSSSAGIYQTVRRLEEQRSKNKNLHKKLNKWTQMCNVVD